LIKADLHLHSTFSDGLYEVRPLLELVRKRGVTLASLTDHDTIAGVNHAQQAGMELGMQVISGVELAAGFKTSATAETREVHLLAYGIDLHHRELLELLERNRAARRERNLAIIARLKLMDLHLDPDVLNSENPVGRPHLARLLVESGQVKSFQQVFAKYIGDGGPAWRPRRLESIQRVCAVVRAAGGLPVLAHPLKSLDFAELEQLPLPDLAGIEIDHPAQGEADRERLRAWGESAGLLLTGGSDFHGPGLYLCPRFDPAPLLAKLHQAAA